VQSGKQVGIKEHSVHLGYDNTLLGTQNPHVAICTIHLAIRGVCRLGKHTCRWMNQRAGSEVTIMIIMIMIIISNLSDDRSTASSKTIPPLNAI
jgi:hypothetical protein